MGSNSCSKDLNFTGQVALVTGGGRGLGQAFAISLASVGATVNIAARSFDQLKETLGLIKANGGQGYAQVMDVTNQNAVEDVVKQIEKEQGPLDLLVNNAATMHPLGPIWEVDPDQWWRCLDTNLRGPFLCSRAVLPGMIREQRGRIINVSSTAGIMNLSYLSAYVISKSALIRFTESLASETSEHGISVFAISPGAVRTAMTEYTMGSKEGQKWTPWFKEFYKKTNEGPQRASDLIIRLASGMADVLSGRFIEHSDNLEELIKRANEIKKGNLYVLKVDKLG